MRSGVVRGHRSVLLMGIDGESKERNNRVWKRIQALHVYMIPSWIIFLTKNGEGDLVVMDIETYNRREKMLKLREELLAVEEDRIAGRNGCTLDELDAYLDDVIAEV